MRNAFIRCTTHSIQKFLYRPQENLAGSSLNIHAVHTDEVHI